MISARLPELRERAPKIWKEKLGPGLNRVKHTLGQYLRAQVKLCAVTFLVVAAGLVLLRIPFAPLWAAGVALVDAAPVLGTGTVLLPWSLICLLQGDSLRGLGLLALYACAALTRTVLEPRLLGRQLGLDPLLTLAAMYMGFRLGGIPGMLLTPLAAAAVGELMGNVRNES